MIHYYYTTYPLKSNTDLLMVNVLLYYCIVCSTLYYQHMIIIYPTPTKLYCNRQTTDILKVTPIFTYGNFKPLRYIFFSLFKAHSLFDKSQRPPFLFLFLFTPC